MITEEQKNSLLKDEYLKLQDIYESFDQRALTIKGWAITICLGGIAVGFEKSLDSLWYFSGIAAVLFWWIEAKWKTFQYSNSLRIRQIEGYFRNDDDKKDLKPLQIYNTWYKSYVEGLHPHTNKMDNRSPRQKIVSNARLSLVYTPYIYIILIDIILIGWRAIA